MNNSLGKVSSVAGIIVVVRLCLHTTWHRKGLVRLYRSYGNGEGKLLEAVTNTTAALFYVFVVTVLSSMLMCWAS